MKNIIWFTCLLLFVGISLHAQRQETLFSHHGGLTGIWGAATVHFSNYNDDWTLVRGGYGALEFGHSVLIGWGSYKFRDEVSIENTADNFKMRYDGLLLGITPSSRKLAHPKLTFLIGGGKVFLDDGDRDKVFVFQPSGGLEVNIFRWFRLGLEGGYRFVGNTDQPNLSNGDLSAPFAQLDFRFGISL